MPFGSHGDHRGHGERSAKDLKNLRALRASVPPCETLYTSHPVFDLMENTKDTENDQPKI